MMCKKIQKWYNIQHTTFHKIMTYILNRPSGRFIENVDIIYILVHVENEDWDILAQKKYM